MKLLKNIPIKKLHIIILILGSIFISLSIFHTSLWFDETYSVAIANHSIKDIWVIGGNDVHPVLYYWMLRIVCLLTEGSILAYRIFSAIPIVLLGLVGFTHIRKDFGEKTGLFFTFITLFIPMSAVYANQIRMYSWAILILTLFFIYSYRIYKGEETVKNWIVFGLLSLCSIYIHYYGLMTAGITNVMLFIWFIKNKRKKAIINIVLLGILQLILYLPWLIYFVSQLEHVSEGFWITLYLDDILKLIGCQLTGNLNTYIGATLSILLYIYLFKFVHKKRTKFDIKPIKISIFIYITVIIVALLITVILKTPILYFRYLYVITGIYIFVVSYILAHEENKYIIGIICLIILVLGIANNVYQIKENYDNNNLNVVNYLKENIEDSDEIVYSHIGNGSIIAVNFNNKQYFYNPEDWGVKKAYRAYGPQMNTYTSKDFIEKSPNRIWLIDTIDEALYNDLFKNKDYKIVKSKSFKTDYYEEYDYNIKLLEKIEK